jgi:propanol-preferring alcohol dehydrogenase
VANLTRKDGEDFFELASEIQIKTKTQFFPLQEAYEALVNVRGGKIQGAAELVM